MGQLEAYHNHSEVPEQCKGKHEIQELKTAILGPAHVIVKVMMQKYKTFSTVNVPSIVTTE